MTTAITLSIANGGTLTTLGAFNLSLTATADTNVTFPTDGILVNEMYVNNLIYGLNWKASVLVIATSNITLAGEQTINGIAVVAGNSVLVANQTDATQNGIYVVAIDGWTRRSDADTGARLVNASVLVTKGTLYPDTQWKCTNDTIVIGVTNIVFVQFAGVGTYTADGTTLTLTGNQFSINTGYVGQSSITTLGTVTTGVWQGTAVTDSYIATPYIKADGTRALTGNWNAGLFSGTFNSVAVGSAANTISGVTTLVNGSGNLTLPSSTDTLVGKATTDSFTNKTFNTAATGNVFQVNGTGITAVTGSGSTIALSNTPAFTTPSLGAATATSINGLAITSSTGTLTIANGKTATISNTLAFAGTDSTTITFQGTDTYVGRTTSDTLTNKSMSGSTNTFTNIPSSAFTDSFVKANGSTPLTGNWAAGAFSGTFNSVIVGSAANTISGLATIINSGTLTLPTSTDTLVGKATTDIFTNKTFNTAGTGNSFSVNSNAINAVTGSGSTVALATNPIFIGPSLGVASSTSETITGTAGAGYVELQTQSSFPSTGATNSVRLFSNVGSLAWVKQSDGFTRSLAGVFTASRIFTLPDLAGTFTVLGNSTTGSGNIVLDTTPTLVTPVLGVATATSINKVAITAPATSATLTIANGKTLTASNTLTFTGTDSSSVAFGSGGTVAYTSNNLGIFASTSSSQLRGIMSDSTGSGSLVFATNPAFTTPTADSMNFNGTGGAGFIQLNTQSATPSAGVSSSVRVFTDSLGRFCWFPEVNQFVRRIDATLTSNRIFTLPDQAGTFTVLGNSTTGTGSFVLDTNAALTTPTATSMNMVGVNGAGFLQLNSQVSGNPSAGNSNSVRLFSTSGGGLAYIQQNDGFTRFLGGTFTASHTITFQDKSGTVYVTGGTNVAIADGGTGAGSAATARTNLGININSARNYSDHTSLGFGTARTPSTTNDTYVIAVVSITESNGNQGSASAVIDGTTTIANVLLNHATVAAGTLKTTGTMSFICPANSSYTINSAGGGTVSLNSIYELTM